jgi:hypothetical protein
MNGNNWHYRPTWVQLALRKNLVGAEIGSLKGTNSHFMLSNLNIKKLYLIDPYFKQAKEFEGVERPYIPGTYDEEAHNIAKKVLSKFQNIEWLTGTTEQVIDKIEDDSLDFCYIDGCHEYEFVKKDIELCSPKMKTGRASVLGGHDFHKDHPGVVKAVIEKFTTDKLFVGNRDWWIIIK